MNISYNWLKDYLDLSLTPEEVSSALTSIGLETGGIEEVQAVKGGLEGLVIGKVLTCEAHPNSDHLHITTVDLGDGVPTQIVCGAPNVSCRSACRGSDNRNCPLCGRRKLYNQEIENTRSRKQRYDMCRG